MDINYRIAEIINHYDIEQQEIAKKISVTPATISKIVKGLSVPGGRVLVEILAQYPEVSAEWLMRGTGNMLLNQSKSTELQESHISITQTQYDDLIKDIKELKSRVRNLEDED